MRTIIAVGFFMLIGLNFHLTWWKWILISLYVVIAFLIDLYIVGRELEKRN